MKKASLFSEIQSVLTLNGAPLTNAELIRAVRWHDENHQDITNSDGEFNAFQKLVVKHNNEEI